MTRFKDEMMMPVNRDGRVGAKRKSRRGSAAADDLSMYHLGGLFLQTYFELAAGLDEAKDGFPLRE
jgi:hypothetical protein